MSVRKDGKIIAGTTVNPDLFDWKWADHILDNASWLRADTFSWQCGAVYLAAYAHLADDYNGSIVYNKAKFVKEINPTYNYWRAMCYGGGKFVALTQDGYVTTSTDGITWTTPTQNTNLGNNYWWGLVYVNGTFYALGAYGRKSTSTDGVTWTANVTDSNFSGKGYFYSLIWDGTYFRAVGETGYIGTSSDWTNWTFTRPDELAMAGFATRCFGLAYNGSVYVVSLDNNKVSTSSDFVHWTERTQVFNGTGVRRLCYDGEKFVAVSNPSSGDLIHWQVCVSFDGTNWGPARAIDGYEDMVSDTGGEAAICKTTDGHYAILTFGANLCISDTYETETIGGTTIEFITTADGHKICPARQHDNVSSAFNLTGDAWYYILDTTNQRFKLPRRRSRKIIRAGTVNGVWYRLYADGWVEQGGVVTNSAETVDVQLPITMSDTSYMALADLNYGNTGWSATVNVAVLTKTTASITIQNWYNSSYNTGPIGWKVAGFSAIDTSGLQGNEKYTYFYVGNFTQTALQNTAGINAELFNEKLDRDFSNATTDIASSLNNVGARTVVETYVNGTNWYRKYSDKWVEQGCDAHNRGSSNRWNFLIGMAGTYNAQITARGSQRYAWVTDMGSTYLTFNAADDSSQNNDGLYYIKVCGYAAS